MTRFRDAAAGALAFLLIMCAVEECRAMLNLFWWTGVDGAPGEGCTCGCGVYDCSGCPGGMDGAMPSNGGCGMPAGATTERGLLLVNAVTFVSRLGAM